MGVVNIFDSDFKIWSNFDDHGEYYQKIMLAYNGLLYVHGDFESDRDTTGLSICDDEGIEVDEFEGIDGRVNCVITDGQYCYVSIAILDQVSVPSKWIVSIRLYTLDGKFIKFVAQEPVLQAEDFMFICDGRLIAMNYRGHLLYSINLDDYSDVVYSTLKAEYSILFGGNDRQGYPFTYSE